MKTLQIHAAVKIRCGGRDSFEKRREGGGGGEEGGVGGRRTQIRRFQLLSGYVSERKIGKISWIFFVAGR